MSMNVNYPDHPISASVHNFYVSEIVLEYYCNICNARKGLRLHFSIRTRPNLVLTYFCHPNLKEESTIPYQRPLILHSQYVIPYVDIKTKSIGHAPTPLQRGASNSFGAWKYLNLVLTGFSCKKTRSY